MKAIKRTLIIITVILLLMPVSVELFYRYKVYKLQPIKVLSTMKYSLLSHDILWVSFKEKGKKHLEKFTATRIVYSLIKSSIFNRSNRHSSVFPRGMNILSQVAKNQLMSQQTNKPLNRHLNKAVYLIWASNNYKEDEAFDYVLDSMFYGNNLHGLSEASKYYYGKNVKTLNFSENISLLTISIAPSMFDPFKNIEKHKKRAHTIAQNLKKNWPFKYQNLNYSYPTFINRTKLLQKEPQNM